MKKYTILILILITECFNLGAQTNKRTEKLVLTNVKNGEVYYEEQPEFKSQQVYTVELHFSNPIAKIEMKEPVSLTLDNKPNNIYKLVDYEIPVYRNDKKWNSEIKLDTVIAINYWDSTNVVQDKKNPGTMISSPIIQYFRIDWIPEHFGIDNIKLHIPAGTFIDIYGNKNEEINITYKKRKK